MSLHPLGEVGFRYWRWSGRINGHHRIEWKNPRQGYPKKKIRMHEPCARKGYSCTKAVNRASVWQKKKRQEKRRFLPCLATSGVSNIYDVTATLLTAKIRSNNTLFISEFNATSAPKHSLHTALICTNI